MVYSDFPFNPRKDLKPVDGFGFVDLKQAFVHNTIPSNVASVDTDYNGIVEPASIMGKPRDVFEAMDMQSHIKNYKPDSNNDA